MTRLPARAQVPAFAMACRAEVLACAKQLPGLGASVPVPNLKGAERALECNADLMLLPLSASHAHSVASEAAASLASEQARYAKLVKSAGVTLN